MHSMISQLWSHPQARLVLMVITPGGVGVGGLMYIDSFSQKPTSSQIQEHTEITLMVTGDIRRSCHACVFLQ